MEEGRWKEIHQIFVPTEAVLYACEFHSSVLFP